MGMVPFTNAGSTVVHVGNKTIWPGQTREVDETLLKDYKAKAPVDVEPNATVIITGLLALSVKDIIAALPGLSDDDLALAEQLESAKDDPRSTALEAIHKEKLHRAKAAQEAAEFVVLLADMDDEELAAQLDTGLDDGLAALVQAEIDKRAAAGE